MKRGEQDVPLDPHLRFDTQKRYHTVRIAIFITKQLCTINSHCFRASYENVQRCRSQSIPEAVSIQYMRIQAKIACDKQVV